MSEYTGRSEEELLGEEYGFPTGEEEARSKTKKKGNVVEKPEDTSIRASYVETPEHILEQIRVAGLAGHAECSRESKKYKYIKYTKLDGTYSDVEEFDTEGNTYKPIEDALAEKKTVKLPTGVEEYGETADLIKDIHDFICTYVEPPKFYEKFLPYYILFTWVYDKFPFIAYLHFVGLTGTGKTIAAETISNICYKSIDAAGSVTIASIFRIADKWKGTLFLDEFDLSSFGKEGYMAVLTFLKTGVSDRTLLRVEGEKVKEVQSFSVKSPKIFTSEHPITDAGLQSRTFVIRMEKNKRKLPLYKLNTYEEKAVHLRNKLLLWRLRNLAKINLSEIEYGFPELQGFDGRVQQIITPIYYLSDEETKKDVLEFAKAQEEETFRERREALEGQIFAVIHEIYPAAVMLGAICEVLNKGRPANFQITEKKVANVLRKIFHFDIAQQGHDKTSYVVMDDDRYEELKRYYGYHRLECTASPASPATPENPCHEVKEGDEEIDSDVQEAMEIFNS